MEGLIRKCNVIELVNCIIFSWFNCQMRTFLLSVLRSSNFGDKSTTLWYVLLVYTKTLQRFYIFCWQCAGVCVQQCTRVCVYIGRVNVCTMYVQIHRYEWIVWVHGWECVYVYNFALPIFYTCDVANRQGENVYQKRTYTHTHTIAHTHKQLYRTSERQWDWARVKKIYRIKLGNERTKETKRKMEKQPME